MAASSTYTPIATTTLGSAASSYTFSSIPSTYTDLVLIANTTAAGNQNILLRFNSDSGTNYSYTRVTGAASATSNRESSIDAINLYNSSASLNGVMATTIIQVMNYANSTTYKTVIGRGNGGANEVNAQVGLWRSTSAITSLTLSIFTTNFSAGSTFTLYGIASA
jgi:hypothetical protein